MSAKETKVFVDAIEDDVVRVLVGDSAIEVPRALLPDDAREGDWLTLRMDRGASPPDDTEDRRRNLAKDDPGGDLKL